MNLDSSAVRLAGLSDGGTGGGCTTGTDCPGMDTECQTRSCTAGMCGFIDTPAGTPVTMQTPGDCHKNVCDGMGGVTTTVDNNDVPDDSNPCTTDSCNSVTGCAHAPIYERVEEFNQKTTAFLQKNMQGAPVPQVA